jgi:16S rRNA (guanine527-N7)-methyltransferase
VVPNTPRRRERGKRDDHEPALGHGPGFARTSFPRSQLPTTVDSLPELDPVFWRVVDDGLAQLDISLGAGGRRAIDAHARLLGAWNAAINLTALRDPRQVAAGHVLDSLSALSLVGQLGGPRTVLDLGSGGGYPGLPLAVALPAERCALVDSVRKKASFLAIAGDAAMTAMDEAGEVPPAVVALAERAEDLAQEPDHRQQWQVVLARAVGSMAEVAELALPLLTVGGHLIAWKRDSADGALRRELAAADAVVRACGGGPPQMHQIPGADRLGLPEHVLVLVQKRRPTPDRFPRPAAERRRTLLT